MIFESTVDNIITLMRVVGAAKREQLTRFFSDRADSARVDFYLDNLVLHRVLDYDKERDLLSYHNAPAVIDVEQAKKIRAFWVVAAFRSESVREIALMSYPTQFLVITEDNNAYDITVCLARTDAQIAQKVRYAGLCRDVPDEINHIAVVDSVSEGEGLSKYGFDSFCVLGADNVPEYHTWD